jgi:Pyruvate/2-oxoacid:ferredoxin oxidoreductase gamma subunit
MDIVDVLKGLKKNGKILINTTKDPKDFDFSKKYTVATIDATGVAIKQGILVGGIPVVNTPILGAVPRILDRVTLKSIQETVKGKWKSDLATKNVNATQDAYDQVEVKS